MGVIVKRGSRVEKGVKVGSWSRARGEKRGGREPVHSKRWG